MRFLFTKTCWSNIELGMLKVCVGSVYLIAGVYFHEALKGLLWLFGLIFIITCIWTFSLWLKKMKADKSDIK